MKLLIIRKKIIKNSVIASTLLILLGMVMMYDSYKTNAEQQEAQRLNSETANIQKRSIDLKNKVAEAKKYQDIWKTISPNKKLIGNLKIDDVIARIDKLSEKYAIEKPMIKMTIPEELKNEVFKRSTVLITVSIATLTFDALNDVKALNFISEFAESVPGYVVITNFDIRRTKKYNDQDLVELSTGKGSGAITGKVDFFWYLYKQLPDPKAQDSVKADQPNGSGQ